MSVQTVTGVVNKAELGITTPHEHVFIELTAFFEEHYVEDCESPSTAYVTMDKLGILNRDPYAIRDNLSMLDYETQKREILRFKKAGGKIMLMSIKGRAKRNLSAKPVAQVLRIIRVPKENIAPRGATKGETAMNNKDFYTVLMLYKTSMNQAKTMFEKGFISADDYSEINTILADKYGLSSCSIFAENELINTEHGGNIASKEVLTDNESNKNQSFSEP